VCGWLVHISLIVLGDRGTPERGPLGPLSAWDNFILASSEIVSPNIGLLDPHLVSDMSI
jgi:hypothetical protein